MPTKLLKIFKINLELSAQEIILLRWWNIRIRTQPNCCILVIGWLSCAALME
jgi:hypothetical protein